MSVEGERGRRGGGSRQGNIVSHEPASDNSTVQNVLGLLQDYVPQAVTGSKVEKKERVLWAHFETATINDVRRYRLYRGGRDTDVVGHDPNPLILIIGVVSGFSIWHIPPTGDAREVYCCYGDGETARTVRLLPTPEPSLQDDDEYINQRPIIAVVKKGRGVTGSVPYSTLQLLSLRATDNDALVKKFQFKGKPILGIHSNQRVIVVVFKKRVLVMDAKSLGMKFHIRNNYPLEHIVNPVALGHRWLAVTETQMNSKLRSSGGVCMSQLSSVATTVIKNVRKGLSAISDTLSGLTGKVQQTTAEPSDSPSQSVEQSTVNVVTVLDTSYNHPEEVRLHEAGRVDSGIIAHFIATVEQGSHIAAMAFNPSGSLLVTASTEGHSFNVFHLIPHPFMSAESAVHHLYTLYRGTTLASVQDISISCDSRWVTVSTLNGTSHVFPITPYGGEINVRTHTSNRVVNKMSRFHTSAGIETTATQSHSHVSTTSPSTSTGIVSSPPTTHSPPHHHEHLPHSNTQSITWNNPRGIPLPNPITVKALYQIKQPYLTNDDGSRVAVGVASSISPAPSNPTSDSSNSWLTTDSQCVCTLFTPNLYNNGTERTTDSPIDSAGYTLYVLGGNGTLTQYSLQPRPHEDAREGVDAPISLECHAHICWRLLSKPHPLTMKLPLAEDNPLIIAVNELKIDSSKTSGDGDSDVSDDREWLSQVELLTHATPTRRLWMGPQFSFKTYHSHTTLPATSPRQAQLSEYSGVVVPATGNLISLSPDPSQQRPLSTESGESAVLSPSHDTLLSDLFQQPPELTSLHTSPIPMPPRSGSREHGMESGSHSMERGVVEVYGSWNKMAPRLEASQTTDVAERLAEAIDEHLLYPPMSQPQVTMATQRPSQKSTGFQTSTSDQPL